MIDLFPQKKLSLLKKNPLIFAFKSQSFVPAKLSDFYQSLKILCLEMVIALNVVKICTRQMNKVHLTVNICTCQMISLKAVKMWLIYVLLFFLKEKNFVKVSVSQNDARSVWIMLIMNITKLACVMIIFAFFVCNKSS